MGRRSLESKREKRRRQRAKRKLRNQTRDGEDRIAKIIQNPTDCGEDRSVVSIQDTVHEDRSVASGEDNYRPKVYPELGVDFTAELMKFEDCLKEPSKRYTHEYLLDCRKTLRLRLEECHQRLEESLSENTKLVFKHRQEIERIRSFYQTIAYGTSRSGLMVRTARAKSASAAELLKKFVDEQTYLCTYDN